MGTTTGPEAATSARNASQPGVCPHRYSLAAAWVALLVAGAAVNFWAQPAQGSGGPPFQMLSVEELIEVGRQQALMAQDAPDLARCIQYVARAHTYGCVFRSNCLPDCHWGSEFDLEMTIEYAQDFDNAAAWTHRQAALLNFEKALALDATNAMTWKGRGFLYAKTAAVLASSNWLPTTEGIEFINETEAEKTHWETIVARLNAPAQADRQAAQREIVAGGGAAEPALIRHLRDPVLKIRQASIALLAQRWRELAIEDSLRAWQCHCEWLATHIENGSDENAEHWKSDVGLNYLRLVRERGVRENEKALVAQVQATLSADALVRLDPPSTEIRVE